jgi:ribonuclease BN (tRNA processing enzyme)
VALEMDVTVLGKSPSWPDAGGACSGYLIREGGYALLLDCGTGVYAKLREHIDYRAVDAIVISHLHPDHTSDLVPYSFGLSYSSESDGRRPELHVPPAAGGFLEGVGDAWGFGDQLARAFTLSEYDPEGELALGPLRIRFCEVPHFVRCFAIDIGNGRGRFTYGADCAPNQALPEFARGTDLLMLEATELPDQVATDGLRGHMTAAEAGAMAAQAQAPRLVLTHFSDQLDEVAVRTEAQASFGGPVELAAEGQHFAI